MSKLKTCTLCGEHERITDFGGVTYTNISPNSNVCRDCLNNELDKIRREEEKKRRHARTPRTKKELKEYYIELQITLGQKPIQHNGTVKEIRRDINKLKQQCRQLELDIPEFDERTMKNWNK